MPPGQYLINNYVTNLTKTVIVQGDSTSADAPLIMFDTSTALLNNPTRNWYVTEVGGRCVFTNSANYMVAGVGTGSNDVVQQVFPGCGAQTWFLGLSSFAGHFHVVGSAGALDLDGDDVVVNSVSANSPTQAWKFVLIGQPPVGK